MSDASYYSGIIGLHRISIAAQKPRFFYTRQAAFNISARILIRRGIQNAAYRARGNAKCRLPWRLFSRLAADPSRPPYKTEYAKILMRS